eukprot:2958933-Rhodomonas_salina.1
MRRRSSSHHTNSNNNNNNNNNSSSSNNNSAGLSHRQGARSVAERLSQTHSSSARSKKGVRPISPRARSSSISPVAPRGVGLGMGVGMGMGMVPDDEPPALRKITSG